MHGVVNARAIKPRPFGNHLLTATQEENDMATATRIGTAGLQGWRRKVGDTVAEPVAKRTPLATEQVRAAVGALFFVLSVMYVVKTLTAASRELREG